MKKTIITSLVLFISIIGIAQNYDLNKLKELSKIWGEVYLFHPTIVRSDKNTEWEKHFVEFLPKVKGDLTKDEFIAIVNSDLLAALEDPFTIIQKYNYDTSGISNLNSANSFDYLRITEKQLSNLSSLMYIDSIISDRSSGKALVVDVRINEKLKLDQHSNTLFDYFMSMLIDNEIPLCSSITREHFGWDEYNDWWFYEQRWKVTTEDKQISNNGKLMPLKYYSQELSPYLQNYNFDDFTPIKRPIYFITNNSFLSYYSSQLISLQTNRLNTFIINENAGKIFPANTNLRRYTFNDFEFILNTAIHINKGVRELKTGINEISLNQDQIIEFVNSVHQDSITECNFSFTISPKKYQSPNDSLSLEEKILGVVKTWTIVNYFYPYTAQMTVDWDVSLEKYLQLSQNTSSDKDYYTLIQEMMATLNDSHVSTFHPSILNFSEIFVVPVQFDWIEDKVIITAIDTSVTSDINVGDEITSINDLSIKNLLENEAKKISHSNRQGLLSTVINPGYFTGPLDSKVKFGIKSNDKIKTVEIPRSMYIFQFMGFGDNRQTNAIFESGIGYLNLAALSNSSELENELIKMKDTRSLIIDLRNSYPTADYQRFLQMLTQKEVATRISIVPIVSATQAKVFQTDITTIKPISSFSYKKPIIVLIDKTMISRPEDIAIALKSLSNVRFVGEQTQGTDGEMTKINLPGGGETSFTGQIVKFGNEDNFYRTGLIPDIEVKQTINGIKQSKDEVLEKALEILRQNQRP